MNDYQTNSSKDIVYIDYSSSVTGSTGSASSADPTNLATLMRKSLVIVHSFKQLKQELPGNEPQRNRTEKPIPIVAERGFLKGIDTSVPREDDDV